MATVCGTVINYLKVRSANAEKVALRELGSAAPSPGTETELRSADRDGLGTCEALQDNDLVTELVPAATSSTCKFATNQLLVGP